jgi:sulfide dehydrogenase cytochrome subunit
MKNRLRAALGAIVLAGQLGAGAQAQTTPPAGRLLASNCFQCHGTNGYSSAGFDKLVGMTADELLHKMKEMQTSGERGIMNVHALGYSDAQIRSLAAFFASQPKP